MNHLRILMATVCMAVILAGVSGCDKEPADEPASGSVQNPTPTPTPEPNPDDDEPQTTVNSSSVFTDLNGKKFVLTSCRMISEGEDFEYKFTYNLFGQPIKISEAEYITEINYQNNTARTYRLSNPFVTEGTLSFTMNKDGFITSIKSENDDGSYDLYKFEYSEGFLVEYSISYNALHDLNPSDNSRIIISWIEGNIDSVIIDFPNDNERGTIYRFTNNEDNPLHQYKFPFWASEIVDIFYLCGKLGKAPEKFPTLFTVIDLDTMKEYTYNCSYSFNNSGRLYNEYANIDDDPVKFSYSYSDF